MSSQHEPLPAHFSTAHPTGTVEDRVERLENIAYEGQSLTRAVTRLGLNADALTEALETVDRNQARLTQLGKELEETKQDVVPREVRERERIAALRRRRQALLRLLAFLFVFVPLAAYLAINVHEVYRDSCDTTLTTAPGWCDDVFVFDRDHGVTGNPLQGAVRQLTDATRQVCEDSNQRARVSAAVLLQLAANGDTTADRARLVKASDDLTATLQDCERLYPHLAGGH